MTAKLQPPVGPERAEVRWRESAPDRRRTRRIAEILADILDNAEKLQEGRRP